MNTDTISFIVFMVSVIAIVLWDIHNDNEKK